MYGGTWFYPVHQNVIWTLLLGLLGIHLMETVRKKQKTWLYLLTALLVVLIGTVLGTLSMVDYYGAGVLTIFIFYFFRGRKWWCLAGQLLALYWVNVQLLGGLLYPVHIFGMEFEICQQGLALLALLPHLAVPRTAGLSQQAVPVCLLCLLSRTYADPCADPAISDPLTDIPASANICKTFYLSNARSVI